MGRGQETPCLQGQGYCAIQVFWSGIPDPRCLPWETHVEVRVLLEANMHLPTWACGQKKLQT